MDLFPLLRRALKALDPNTPATRRTLYARARSALESALGNLEPPIGEAAVELEMRLFQVLVRTLEADIRARIDIHAETYRPQGLEQMRRRLAAKLIPAPAPATPPVSEQTRDVADYLKWIMHNQDRRSLYALRKRAALCDVCLASLIVLTRVLASESKMMLAWLAVKPALFFMFTHLYYVSVAGDRYIFNMPSASFSAIGICCLFLVMETGKRVSAAMSSYKFLWAIPQISWILVGISEGFLFFLINTVMLFLIMGVLILADQAPWPSQPVLFLSLWFCLWIVSVLLGFILHFVSVTQRFLGRVVAVSFRLLAFFSGAAFVTEQLPEHIANILLYNPLLHVVQGMRAAYFDTYQSPQVNLGWFFLCMGFFTPFATLLVTSVRYKVAP